MNSLRASIIATLSSCALAAACATTSGKGSETHFVCSKDADCSRTAHCVGGSCVANAGGANGNDESGGSGMLGGAAGAGALTGTPQDPTISCTLGEPRMPCDDGAIDCIADLRTVSSRLLSCFPGGPGGLPYVARCGDYDLVSRMWLDTVNDYYFDHSDGHFVAALETGMILPPVICKTLEPDFTIPDCETLPGCGDLCPDTVDPGAPPAFCPPIALPRPEPGRRPTSLEAPDSLTLKFVEGSHVRTVNGRLAILQWTMLDEDPGLLRCAGLTVQAAQCDLSGVVAALSPNLGITVTPVFDRPSKILDQERSQGRQTSGEYLNDLNLYYLVTAPAEMLPSVYAALAEHRVIDTVYYNTIPSTP